MSTRSVIAIPAGDSFRGRYCHGDGYPSWQLVKLHELVARDGVEKVIATIITGENYGWSSLNPATTELHLMYQDGRFALIPGYGVAYTSNTNPPQATEDMWITPEGDNWAGAEYAYVLSESGVAVYANGSSWQMLGFHHWSDDVKASVADLTEKENANG